MGREAGREGERERERDAARRPAGPGLTGPRGGERAAGRGREEREKKREEAGRPGPKERRGEIRTFAGFLFLFLFQKTTQTN